MSLSDLEKESLLLLTKIKDETCYNCFLRSDDLECQICDNQFLMCEVVPLIEKLKSKGEEK